MRSALRKTPERVSIAIAVSILSVFAIDLFDPRGVPKLGERPVSALKVG